MTDVRVEFRQATVSCFGLECGSMTEYENILKIVREWPTARRFTLVQDLLKTLAPSQESPIPKRETLRRALGLLSSDQPAPSDEDIRSWLNEHRMEKYG